MKKELRNYQQQACKAVHVSMHKGERPYASLFTGLGKSLCLVALTNRYVNEGKRILQLVPRLELVEQNYAEAFDYMDNKEALGIVCSQLGKNQRHKQAVVAMASSFVNKRTISGSFDYILIDECHRVNFKKEYPGLTNKFVAGQYERIIKALLSINPDLKVCGFTGTGYRLDQGELHEETHKTKPFFTHKVFDTAIDPGLKQLIADGYLSHIETLNSDVSVNLDGVSKSGYDYNQAEAGIKFDAIIENAVADMRQKFIEHNITTAVIFASSVANANHILSAWDDNSTMRIIYGDMPKNERKDALNWLKNGSGCRYLVNVNLLTEGYDHRALECVVLLRATTSPGLLVQMVGRVIRPHEDKIHGFLIDYGTNLSRLTNGGIENVIVPTVRPPKEETPKKECTAYLDEDVFFENVNYKKNDYCGHLNHLGTKYCRKCKAQFISESEDGLYSMRTKVQALALKQEQEKITYDVNSVYFEQYQKGDTPMIKMLFYDEFVSLLHTEYLCIEHQGSAKGLAIAKIQSLMKNKKDWYQIGKFEGGHNVKNMLFLFENYYDQYFHTIKTITVIKDGRFNKLISWEF